MDRRKLQTKVSSLNTFGTDMYLYATCTKLVSGDHKDTDTENTRYRHTLGTPKMFACNAIDAYLPGALRQMCP